MYKFLYAYCIWHFICVLVFPSSIFTQYNKICECSLKTKTAQYQFASTMTLQLTHCHLRKSGLKENPDFPTGTTLRWCSSRKYNHSDMTRRQQSHMEGWKVCVCEASWSFTHTFPLCGVTVGQHPSPRYAPLGILPVQPGPSQFSNPAAAATLSCPGTGRGGGGRPVRHGDGRPCRTSINFNRSCQRTPSCLAGMKHMPVAGIHHDSGIYFIFPLARGPSARTFTFSGKKKSFC